MLGNGPSTKSATQAGTLLPLVGRSLLPRPGDAQSNVRRLPASAFPSTWCTAINWYLAQLGAAGALAGCNEEFHTFTDTCPTISTSASGQQSLEVRLLKNPFLSRLSWFNRFGNSSNTSIVGIYCPIGMIPRVPNQRGGSSKLPRVLTLRATVPDFCPLVG